MKLQKWVPRFVIIGVVTLLTLTLVGNNTVNASSTKKQQQAITKLIKRDMRGVGGKWSVKVTRLSGDKLSITTGNHKVGQQRSASTIKVYVMLTVYQLAKSKRLKLTKSVNGDLGRMIGYSDNSATNRLIRRVGGFKRVTNTAKKYGFNHTILKRFMLGSLKNGDNYTTVTDLTNFLTKTYRHDLLGKKYDGKMLTLLRHCRNHSKLPKLVSHAVVYNKTGEYPAKGVQNDATLFKTKQGVYSVVVMSQAGNQGKQYKAMNRLGKDVVNRLNRN